MGSSIQVYLDNCNNGLCYPGQTIAGRVQCYFDKQKGLRAVRVKFRGRAKTYWTESESYYDSVEKKHKTRQVHYSAEEVYFDAQYDLVAGGDNFGLPAGQHTYPFSYILPAQLPSSYEGVHGDIRYTVTATVDRPWKFDYEAKVALNLVSPLDLNYLPEVCNPAATSVDKHLCCFWCKSGPLTFDMSLPATGYVPGQEINIGACVQNMSNVSAEGVKFKLYQEMQYIAHYPHTKTNYSSNTICETRDGGIGAHGEKSWTSKIVIPTNSQYPNLLPCGIMKVSYRLYGEVILPCPHSNLDTEFPFIIGTVPLSRVNLNVPGPPPELPISSFDINPQIIPHMPNPSIGFSENTPLINNPTAPDLPYPYEKVPYSLPSAGEPSSTISGNASTPTAPPIAPSGPPSNSIGLNASGLPSYEEANKQIENNKK